MSNNTLNNAKHSKNDEFYTRLEDIEYELSNYKDKFENKIVYCNCDDSSQSKFWEYFYLNFANLKLKRLISTYYNQEIKPYKTEYDGNTIIKTSLLGNGDFRSKECLDILDTVDIVVTNPPFSLFREYIPTLINHNKKFIVWGNNNAINDKNIFPLFKNNQIWLGYISNKTCCFKVGEGYEYNGVLTSKINDGNKYCKVPAISVFTNIDINKKHEKLELTKVYSEEDYLKYDNYDAINVNKVKDIPINYPGIMGVPISFMSKYNTDQFELIGELNHGLDNEFDYGKPLVNGKCLFGRLLIKYKDQ